MPNYMDPASFFPQPEFQAGDCNNPTAANGQIYQSGAHILSSALQADGLESNRFSILMTGSDGREEKTLTPTSAIELMLILPEVENDSELEATLSKVVSEASTIFYHYLEVKFLSATNRLTAYKNESKPEDERCFVTRAFDARLILGEKALYIEFRTQVFFEIQNPDNKKFIEKFSTSCCKPAIALLKKTINAEDTSHIDITNGIVHNNGDRIKGTKYPFLRPVQYKIAEMVCKLIRNHEISCQTFLTMPFSINDRIKWLTSNRLITINETEANNLTGAYQSALAIYSDSQIELETKGIQQIPVEGKKLGEIALHINHFCQTRLNPSLNKVFNIYRGKENNSSLGN